MSSLNIKITDVSIVVDSESHTEASVSLTDSEGGKNSKRTAKICILRYKKHSNIISVQN